MKPYKKVIYIASIFFIFTLVLVFVYTVNSNKEIIHPNEAYEDYSANIAEVAVIHQQERVLLIDIIISRASLKKDDVIMRMKNYDASISERLRSFESSIINTENKELYKKLKSSIQKYNIIKEKIITLSYEGKESEALALFSGEGKTISNEIGESISKLSFISVSTSDSTK